MATKKITELTSGSLSNLPLSGVSAIVYSGVTHQHTLNHLRQVLVDSGSHTFTGSQTINGNLTINGSIILDNGSVIKDNVHSSISFGLNAGEINQGTQSVALGGSAGQYDQSNGSVAVGALAGAINQGQRAVALGTLAGSNTQGEYAIAIGNFAAPNNQAANSIVISAMGSGLNNTTANSLKIEPIRNTIGNSGVLQYNSDTKEVSYSDDISGFVGNLATTGSNTFNGNQTITGSINITEILNLSPLDPLPTGTLGQLAVSSSSDLYFHNGSSWVNIST